MATPLSLVFDILAIDRASVVFKRVGDSAMLAGTQSESGLAKVTGALAGLAKTGTLAAAAIGVVGVKMATDFQTHMRLIQTQAGASAQELAFMNGEVLKMAGEVGTAPTKLADSLYHIESVGLRGADALKVLRLAAEGAKVGHADLEQTTNALTAAVASGMKGTEDYGKAMGALNTIVGIGDMRFEDLNSALSTGLLNTMKQYGVTLNDVGAALATFGDNNMRGQAAATSLRMAVQGFFKMSTQGEADLAKIGLTAQKLRDDIGQHGLVYVVDELAAAMQKAGVSGDKAGAFITEAFGKRAGSGLLLLLGNLQRVDNKNAEMQRRADSFTEDWRHTTENLSFQWDRLKAGVDAVMISIGNKLLPIVTTFVSFLATNALPGIVNFGHAVGDFIAGPLKTAHDALDVLLHGNWADAGAGLSTGFALKLADIRGRALEVWDRLKDIKESLKVLFTGNWADSKGISAAFALQLADIRGKAEHVFDGIVADVKPWLESIKAGIGTFGQPIIDAIQAGIKTGDFTRVGETIGDALHAALVGAASTAQKLTSALVDLIHKVNWGEIALAVGKQAVTVALAFATGLLTFDIGPLFSFIGHHWIDILVAVISIGALPERLVAGIAGVLAKVPFAGPVLRWMFEAVAAVGKGAIRFVGRMFEAFSEGFLRGAPGLFLRFRALWDTIRAEGQGIIEWFASLPGRLESRMASGLTKFGEWLRTNFAVMADKIVLLFVGAFALVLNYLADHFGWVPIIGQQLKNARDAFNVFGKGVQDDMAKNLHDQSITVDVKGMYSGLIPAQQRASVLAQEAAPGFSGTVHSHATGGGVFGPGSGTSDSIPAMLSNGEHVWTAREVSAAGGHGAVESMRRAVVKGFAAGGPVIVPSLHPEGILAGGSRALSDAAGLMAKDAAKMMSVATTSAGPAGGAAQWGGVVLQVLAMLGQSPALLAGILSLINMESGGNPNAINLTDSNARAGHPSQGLMQTIPSTFAAYAGPYASRGITDPLANIYAGVSYALKNYGPGMLAAGGRHSASGGYLGYEVGTGYVPVTGPAILHEGEAVIPANRNNSTGRGGGGDATFHLYDSDGVLMGTIHGAIDQRDRAAYQDARAR